MWLLGAVGVMWAVEEKLADPTVVVADTTAQEAEIGVNAHVIIMKSQSTFAEYRDVMKTSREIEPDALGRRPTLRLSDRGGAIRGQAGLTSEPRVA